MARDKNLETWLRTTGIAAYDKLKADPNRALSVEHLRQHLANKRREPNKVTAETLAKSERGEDVRRFNNADAMFKDLGI